MLADACTQVVRVQRRSRLRSVDPACTGAREVHGAAAPAVTVAATYIGHHLAIADTRAFQHRDLSSSVMLWLHMTRA